MTRLTEDSNDFFINTFEEINSRYSSFSETTFGGALEKRERQHNAFVLNNIKQYLEDKNKVISGLISLEIPENIADELSIIITESRGFTIEISYPFPKLDNVIEYISKQNLHLSSIRSKLGKDNRIYLRISSSVVKISIINIMCVINEIESQLDVYNNEIMVSSVLKQADVRRRYEIAYHAINQLCSFDMEYGYNYNRFTPCKQDIERACLSKYELRSPHSGCMNVIAIMVVSTLILFL